MRTSSSSASAAPVPLADSQTSLMPANSSVVSSAPTTAGRLPLGHVTYTGQNDLQWIDLDPDKADLQFGADCCDACSAPFPQCVLEGLRVVLSCTSGEKDHAALLCTACQTRLLREDNLFLPAFNGFARPYWRAAFDANRLPNHREGRFKHIGANHTPRRQKSSS